MQVYQYTKGKLPLLISIPHDGRLLAPGQVERMTAAAGALPDTDWFVTDLYQFCERMGAHLLSANYCRYVIDLNRPTDNSAMYAGQVSTGLCPAQTFAGVPIYRNATALNADETKERIEHYWHPYHDKLARTLADIKSEHSYALLWDAHSIASEVPELFKGRLPVLSIGSNNGTSCAPALSHAVTQVAERSPFSSVTDGRFKGGYITRHYGQPDNDIHAVQLELAQRAYMDERELRYDAHSAEVLQHWLENMLKAFLATAEENYQSE